MHKVAVVIPSYRVRQHILGVIAEMPRDIFRIYVVDDKCPENSGQFVLENNRDKRVGVLFHKVNRGVGGATKTGYRQAVADGSEIVVKVDGDGQMDPALIKPLIHPIVIGMADYVKGNRFSNLAFLRRMPAVRLIGNAGLSFITKVTTGYWDIMDPTNGFRAIHAKIVHLLPLDKLNNRYFFESDMLFHLNTLRAVVTDYPMYAKYKNKELSMKISRILIEFPLKILIRFFKRIFHDYLLRGFKIRGVSLLAGAGMFSFGLIFGSYHWIQSDLADKNTAVGTIMLSALQILLGFQMLLSAINYDMASIPRKVLHKILLGDFSPGC